MKDGQIGEVTMHTAASLALAMLLIAPAAARVAERTSDGEVRVIKRHGDNAGKRYHGVHHQQGRVLTDSDANSAAGGSEIISRKAALEQRDALKPLKKRVSTRGMRTREAEYAKKLHLWAVHQDKRLLELQKIHTAYDRLKEYRDNAAADGEDVSRIDPRLAAMERKMAALSKEIRAAITELQELTSRHEAQMKFMSHTIRSQHDAAKAVIATAG